MDALNERIAAYLRCYGLSGETLAAAVARVRERLDANASIGHEGWTAAAKIVANTYVREPSDSVPPPSPTSIAPQQLEMPWAATAEEIMSSAARWHAPVGRFVRRWVGGGR